MPSQQIEGRTRLIAFYLPQYHPIRENDEWWGNGFTEWTNVTKARPQFRGHYQPHLPADLGFYDLRLPEARLAQAELARAHGVFGFCYYFYWFSGRRILERPFEEVLASKQPDFPFCVCWANHDWTRQWWDVGGREVLLKQEYSSEDDIRLIRWLAKAFADSRYIRINGRPLFLVFRANDLPDPMATTARWRQEAHKLGLPDPYLCTVVSVPSLHVDPRQLGFDAAVEFQPDWKHLPAVIQPRKPLTLRVLHRLAPGWLPDLYKGYYVHQVRNYEDLVEAMANKEEPPYKLFPCVTPGWDNSARRVSEANIFIESTPDLYALWLASAVRRAQKNLAGEERLVFVNAWNEWAEGCHLEPDQKWGRQYLKSTLEVLQAVGQSEVEA